jgi:hypothetical protein
MSAPTALESGALQRGIAWRARTHLPHVAVPIDQERRNLELVAGLSREHDPLCRQACDPLEIAAVLEAAGVDDRRSRAEFQAAGVFEVAEQLWRLVPWRSSDEAPDGDRWRLPWWRAQLRGLIYALPLVLAAGAAGQSGGRALDVMLVAATTGCIATGQFLSVLGHLLVGRGQGRAAARLSVLALLGALLVTTAGLAVLAAEHGPLLLGGLAAGQLIFAVSATLLMVAGADRLLLALLAPAAAAVGLGLVGVPLDAWAGLRPGVVQLAAPALSVLAAAVAAWWKIRRIGTGGEPLRRAVGRAELGMAVTAALYGIGLAALASFATVAAMAGRQTSLGTGIVALGLPLTTTLGTAEYLLHRARGRCLAGLGGAGTVLGFRRLSRAELRVMVGLHAGTALLVAVAVLAVRALTAPGAGRLDPSLLQLGRLVAGLDPILLEYAAGYAVLSVTLLLATTLMSLGWVGSSARLACLGGVTVLATAALPGLTGPRLAGVQLGLLVALTLVAYRITSVRFATASAHR